MKTIASLVSIIIVNFNGKGFIERCLRSVLQTTHNLRVEIIVVDSASTDGSFETIAHDFAHEARIKLIRTPYDVGYARANNIGFHSSSGEYIVLLNNDTEVRPHWLSELVNTVSKDPSIGIVQSKLLLLSKPSRIDSVGNSIDRCGFIRQVGFMDYDNEQYDSERQICVAQPTPIIIQRKLVSKVGGLFDDDYWHLHEDTDLSWRVWISGKQIKLASKSVVFHARSATLRKQSQALMCFHTKKNQLLTLLKNYEYPYLLIYAPLCIALMCSISLYYLKKRKLDLFSATIRAFVWNTKNFKRTLKKRAFVQRVVRNVSDEHFVGLMDSLDLIQLFRRRQLWP